MLKLNTRFSIAASMLCAALLFGLGLEAHATNYYVGTTNCSDGYTTSSASAPWCTFTNINTISSGATFQPGDVIYLAAGSTWNQELDLVGTGTGWGADSITLTSYGSGANPIINRNDTTTGTTRCVRLTNPDYWNIENLMVEYAGAGILVEFTTPNHNGLKISGIYATGMEGIPWNGPPTNSDGIRESAGIVLAGPTGDYTLSEGQYALNGLTIGNVEGTGNLTTLELTVPGGNNTTSWGLWNALLQNIYGHQDLDGRLGSFMISFINGGTIMDSVSTDPLGYSSVGNTTSISGENNDLVVMNDNFTDVPTTSPESPDGTGWDNEGDNNGNSYLGNYYANNAGAGIEFLAIHGSGDFDSNNTVNSDLFVNNGGGSSNGSEGAIATNGTADVPSGTASDNLYYEPSYGFDVVFPDSGSGSFSGFTFTNNLAADSASDTWNALNGFSCTQGQNQWEYKDNNGSSVVDMSSCTSVSNVTLSYWSDSNGGEIWGSMMRPDTCNSCWVGRKWTAPKAGNISVRGWVAKHAFTGAVQVEIGAGGSIIWGPYILAAGDETGFSTNIDLTVTEGESITFWLNNDGTGTDNGDATTWSPNIVYTD